MLFSEFHVGYLIPHRHQPISSPVRSDFWNCIYSDSITLECGDVFGED